MSAPVQETIHALGLESANGNSDAFHAAAATVALGVRVTAKAGTNPTLDLEVEWSENGADFGSAETADTFAQISDPTVTFSVAKQFAVKAPYFRLKWTIGGTGSPSLTFAVTALKIQ